MFPFDRYRFGLVIVEHNKEEPKRSDIRALLERNGYVHIGAVDIDDVYEWGGSGPYHRAVDTAPVRGDSGGVAEETGAVLGYGTGMPACSGVGDIGSLCWGHKDWALTNAAAVVAGWKEAP